jgi:SAM-dependent MidA family methyltransferase
MHKLKPTSHQSVALPIPSEDALAASHHLQSIVIEEINKNKGLISFARYMELALYAPRYGYYSGGAAKLGPEGDFTTSPEMTALFGATMAHVAASLFAQTSPNVMEFGAGSGKLAFDFLVECQLSNIVIDRYFIVELSGELRARQEEKLKQFPQVRWLDEMPSAFSGVVIGNEVLDAMPVELIIKTKTGWRLLGVGMSGSNVDVSAHLQDSPSLQLLEMRNTDTLALELSTQIPHSDTLPVGYISEVHPISAGFMRSISQMLLQGQIDTQKAGVAIWLDYGFPAHEYYHEQRVNGTLMCHYRHHAHPDPFYLPGLQDITAHVDFTAMAKAGVESGLSLLAYTSQAGFLLEAGIATLLARIDVNDTARYLPAANAVQKLISPAEMGELFKVLVLGCGIELPDAYIKHDRSHRL